MVILLNIDI